MLQTRVLHSQDMPQHTGSNFIFRLLDLRVVRILDGGVDGVAEEEAAGPEKDMIRWGERPPQRGEVHR